MPEPSLVPEQHAAPDVRPVVRAGVALGVGLMAMLDGVLFHQVLQWHHMVSERTGSMATNVLADGLFHAAAFLVTLTGVVLLWRVMRATRGHAGSRALVGSALLGCAAFNLADVVVAHFLLRLHWLHPSEGLAWEAGFVALNLALGLFAWRLLRSDGTYRLQRAERKHRRVLEQ